MKDGITIAYRQADRQTDGRTECYVAFISDSVRTCTLNNISTKTTSK